MSLEVAGLVLLGALFVVIMIGFPISFTLIFLALTAGYFGVGERVFYLMTYTFWNTMMNEVLAAVALFTFMGYLLEGAGLMNRLFTALQLLSGRMKGSLYLGVVVTAALFAAATGIVGASVTIIGLMAGPVMVKAKYDTSLSAGVIAAGGTLGILIPPSIMLVVMGPVMQISVARLYAAAIIPGCVLATVYAIYCMIRVHRNPSLGPPLSDAELDKPLSFMIKEFIFGMVPVGTLILSTLGAIMSGFASPTEGSALGCVGAAAVAAAHRKLTFKALKEAVFKTAETTSMVMILLAASTCLGSVFSAFGTPQYIADTLLSWNLPGWVFIVGILVVCFVLGWPLEWIPIVVIIIPIFMPVLQGLHVDMIWFAILIAVMLQSCWLSPPVALSAYYLKGVIPEWDLTQIYKGMVPFMGLQAIALIILYFFPSLTLWLPNYLFGQ
ncbi:MAG: TRAP transporter large permease subunit [Desulfobacteraceae bacterium]|nr:TRAP transporter large permease subunit [Desulfobacteraceae bacterium]